jgi:hypothetical protein
VYEDGMARRKIGSRKRKVTGEFRKLQQFEIVEYGCPNVAFQFFVFMTIRFGICA